MQELDKRLCPELEELYLLLPDLSRALPSTTNNQRKRVSATTIHLWPNCSGISYLIGISWHGVQSIHNALRGRVQELLMLQRRLAQFFDPMPSSLFCNILALIQNSFKIMDFEEGDIEEQEYVRPPNPTYDFKLTPEDKIKSKTLCIGFYGVSSLFASTLVSTDKPIANLNFQRAKQRSLASVYANTDSGTVFLIFHEHFEPMKEIHLAQFIQDKFQFESIIVLTSHAKGLLERPEGSSCQYISSSSWKECHGQRYSEGLSGPEADLIVWAELNKIPLICFIGIFDEYEANREVVDNIFGTLNGKFGLTSKNDISGLIKKYNMAKYANRLYL